jgi:uncharacterized membrane protein YdjX (TVP38/TMEM64 family)
MSENRSWMAQHGLKLVALSFWLVLLGGYFGYAWRNELTPLEVVQATADFLRTPAGPLLFIGLYALRPLIFFPASLLTIAGGSIFGAWWGIVYVVLGSNASASVAYLVGRYFGQGVLSNNQNATGIIQQYALRMRNNSFITILVMRFIFLPYDLVNYLAGFLHIHYRAFILATLLGSIPGTISFVLFGASFDISQGLQEAQFNGWALAGSVFIFVVSLALSRYFQAQESGKK